MRTNIDKNSATRKIKKTVTKKVQFKEDNQNTNTILQMSKVPRPEMHIVLTLTYSRCLYTVGKHVTKVHNKLTLRFIHVRGVMCISSNRRAKFD